MTNAPPPFHDGRDWFLRARFGLFLHWGIYAIPAWQEQHIHRKGLSREQYVPLMEKFNPVGFDPDAWLDQAKAAGMRYLCFTTKHIDGFCLWDSALTDFKVTNTPYGRDTLAQLADACHRRDFPLCLYYSVVDDHQPNYPHAGRRYEFAQPPAGDEPDYEKHLDYLRGQVRELCTQYGRIRGWWWDGNIAKWHDPSVNELIRELQPGIVINNRGFDEGDFGTPERDWDAAAESSLAFTSPVEACQSIGRQSWGYRENEDYYTDAHLIGSIQKTFAKGGNYLLNVGPRADGTFPPEATEKLDRIGSWYHSVAEAFDDTVPANDLIGDHTVLLTRRGHTLYVHLHRPPTMDAVYLHPLTELPRSAVLLNTGEPVETQVLDLPWLHNKHPDRCLCLRQLPVNETSAVGWVIKLEFDTLPDAPRAAAALEDTDAEVVGNAS